MPLNQKIFAISIAVIFFVVVLDLVRRKKLRIEYSMLWVFTSVFTFVLVWWYDLLIYFTELIGAGAPKNIIFIFGILFLLLLNLHFTVKLSQQSEMIKNLGQKLAILESELKKNSDG